MHISVERIPVGELDTNSYIVFDKDKNTILIDCGNDPNKVISKLKELKCNLKIIVATHAHYDHITGIPVIKEFAPESVVIVSKEEIPLIEKTKIKSFKTKTKTLAYDTIVKEGDKIELGDISFDVIHTPGHTYGSISLYGHGKLFSGDCLFCGTFGRVDLPTGNLEEIVQTILNKLFRLPEETLVYPGHGFVTTIKAEKSSNEIFEYARKLADFGHSK